MRFINKCKHIFLSIFLFSILIFTAQGCLFKSPIYKGDGYTIIFPEGWEVVETYEGGSTKKPFYSSAKPQEAKASTPQINELTDKPIAQMSVLVHQLTSAAWIEDDFPQILSTIKKYGYKIIDNGEIKISKQLSKWVFFHNLKEKRLYIEFYMITDNNKLYKIQYQAEDTQFKNFRKFFEQSKESFKFKFTF